MSLLSLYSSNVKRKREELARLKKERVRYVNDISNASQKITRLSSQIRGTKSLSTIKSKTNEIEREEKKKSDAEKKVADYDKRIATKEKELCNEELKLQKEQDRENRNIENTRNKEIVNINNKIEYQRLKQIELDNEIKKLKSSKEKINILFIASNPDIIFTDEEGVLREQQRLSLDKEARDIEESIQKTPDRDSISFVTKWATRTEDGKLVFHDKNDNPKFVGIDAIIQMINAITDDLRLVVFSNCFSSSIAIQVSEYVEATIGMNTSVREDVATLFAAQLYSSIGFGFSLDKAFKQAMARLSIEGIKQKDADIPELFVKEGMDANEIYLVKKK